MKYDFYCKSLDFKFLCGNGNACLPDMVLFNLFFDQWPCSSVLYG